MRVGFKETATIDLGTLIDISREKPTLKIKWLEELLILYDQERKPIPNRINFFLNIVR